MARMRTCKLCGAAIKANVAAHLCPHGNPCRYLCGEDDLPVDWQTPECVQCQRGYDEDEPDEEETQLDPAAVRLRLVED